MPTSPLNVIIRQLMADVGPDGSGMTDGELLARFLSSRDENALAALVRRHAPMVWGVCCRLLYNHHDAEDAFQAAFLVLVRKAADVPRQAVANWLYGVARQTAVRMRATAAKRGRREKQVANMPEPTVAEIRDAELYTVLDEELGRLPDHYRGVIIVCEFEGLTRKEAARQLGIPEGSVGSRLARARALLAKRLTRRGIVLSGGSLATALAAGSVSASVPPALMASTIRTATLLAAGQAAGIVSANVAALTEGLVRTMFLAKLKTVSCALTMTILVGLGGMALVPGGGPTPAAGAAPPTVADAKPESEAQRLVRQLGSPEFAARQAAEKALSNLGARAAASVGAGMRSADAEIVRRCAAVWPRLWQKEVARPDADRLAGYTDPLWLRFRQVAGDNPGTRTLFAEMVADFDRFSRLEAVETDPKKAGATYAAELKQRAEALERGYQEAKDAQQRNGVFRTGMVVPASGVPTPGEFVTLLFLGTYPTTAKDEGARDTHNNVFAFGLRMPHLPALHRLYAAWLGTRTDSQPLEIGLSQALYHNIPEVAPVALALAAKAKLAPRVKGFALLAVGRFGTPADIPVVQQAFTDARVFHTTQYTSQEGKQSPVEVRVSDTAVAAALQLAGQHPADFGFPYLEIYKERGPDALTKYYLLGFSDDTTRQAAHKRAKKWLDSYRKNKPRQQP